MKAVLLFLSMASCALNVPQPALSVDAVEHQRIEAVLHADLATLDHILADDWTMTSVTGERLTKRQYLDQLRSGERQYESLKHEDLSVVLHEPVAILSGRTRAAWRDRSGEHQTVGRFTHVYLHERGTWVMLAAHVSNAS